MERAPIVIRATARRSATLALAATLLVAGAARASAAEPWRLLSSTPPFPPTLSIPMGVYDPVRQRVLAIEADLANQPITVFAFDPGPEPRWSALPVSGTAPLEHYLASVVYDPLRDRLLVIGSRAGLPVEAWAATLSGTPAWQELATTGDPPARWGQSATYDPVHDRVVMFGGVAWNSYPTVTRPRRGRCHSRPARGRRSRRPGRSLPCVKVTARSTTPSGSACWSSPVTTRTPRVTSGTISGS